MRPFTRLPDGGIAVTLRPEECRLLRDLARQVAGVLAGGDRDPAMDRLLPDAYPDDPESAAEFRGFTRQGLLDRKLANAARLAATLPGEHTEARLTPEDAQSWLKTLTDLRLVIATRLGIREDGDEGVGDDSLRAVYEWLAFLQDSLLGVLDGPAMTLRLDAEEFERLVIDELDALPDEMVEGLDNVVFVTEDRPEDGSLDLLGIYEGVALTERGQYGFGELPDRIVLFREPLLAACQDIDELRDQVHITLVHEIAHYYGIDDEQLHELGWG